MAFRIDQRPIAESQSILTLCAAITLVALGAATQLRADHLEPASIRVAAHAPGRATATWLAAADCNTNGIDDADDIAAGTATDCNSNGVPDACDLNAPGQIAKLVALDAAANDVLGYAVAASASFAVAGQRSDDDGASNAGSALIFSRRNDAWAEYAKLTAPDPAMNDEFGSAVAIDGDLVIVGTPKDDDDGAASGSAYVYANSNGVWTFGTKLTASDAQADDQFGWSVGVSGTAAVIGAYHDDDLGFNAGAAYLFANSNGAWHERIKLVGGDTAASDNFGTSVAIDGETVVVGAPRDSDGGSASGSAYIFVNSNGVWHQQAKLTANDPAPGDLFGNAVAVTGDVVVVGADGDDPGGSAYLFSRLDRAWSQDAKLVAGDTAPGDAFGSAVAASGDAVLIGVRGDDDDGASSGSAFVFKHTDGAWTQTAKLTASDAVGGDQFGFSVGIDESTIMVGAIGTDDGGSLSGSVYVFAATTDCNENGLPDACDIAAGTSGDCNGNSLLDDCEVLAGGDYDGDGLVGGADFDRFADCFAGCNVSPAPASAECAGLCLVAFDLDHDADVDLGDFAEFCRRYQEQG